MATKASAAVRTPGSVDGCAASGHSADAIRSSSCTIDATPGILNLQMCGVPSGCLLQGWPALLHHLMLGPDTGSWISLETQPHRQPQRQTSLDPPRQLWAT